MTVTRITVACPDAMRDDANQLAMVLGHGPDDGKTYGALNWQDAQGNLYAVASFEARAEWVTAAQSALQRPAWDVWVDGDGYIINMTGAERAQAALVFWSGDGAVPRAGPAILVSVGGMSASSALAAMGLTPVPRGA